MQQATNCTNTARQGSAAAQQPTGSMDRKRTKKRYKKRKAPPECMRYMLAVLNSAAEAAGHALAAVPVEELLRALINEADYSKRKAEETLLNALGDGLLVAAATNLTDPDPRSADTTIAAGNRKKRLGDYTTVRLPNESDIVDTPNDCYCLECHLPGVLEQCRQCNRSFHSACYRKEPERPNYPVPSAKYQKNSLPAFSSGTDSDRDVNDDDVEEFAHGMQNFHGYESDVVRPSSCNDQLSQTSSLATHRFADETITDVTSSSPSGMLEFTTKPETLESEEIIGKFDAETESKTKMEVVCLGEVRPPMRTRPATTASSVSCKSEVTPNDESEETDRDLCTCCRLLKCATLRNPPNLQADELCHLLGFTFTRNRSWIATDAASYMEGIKLSAKCCAIASKLLFKRPEQRLAAITKKLKRQEYTLLMEFLVDILDIQHNIGVFFGTASTEYESTKWLVRDITHDLTEIRRCPDCFRYSHEKNSTVWFAKPCVQRHELVFAKHSGFPYWPAKVIRLLSNRKYDVRFFGGSHSRALIDARFIRPLDSDLKSLKLGNSTAVKKAMEELRFHQLLSGYPPSKFSFHAPAEETEQIIHNVLRGCANSLLDGTRMSNVRRSNKRKLPPTINAMDIPNSSECSVGTGGAGAGAGGSDGTGDTGDGVRADTSLPTKRRRQGKRLGRESEEHEQRLTRSTNHTVDALTWKQMQNSLQDTLKLVDAKRKENELLKQKIEKYKKLKTLHEMEKKLLKRKQWCYWCENEALYLCCFKAAYCSLKCQERHWEDGHNVECLKKQSGQQRPDISIHSVTPARDA